jgi:magnesium-transporting ATPase (P-type)
MGDTDKAIKESSNEVIHMFIKGADGVILPACLATTTSTKAILDQTQVIVNKYASDGLRTLVYGYKKLSRDEFEQFTRKLDLAKQSMVNRDKFVREAYRDLEAEGLDLLGATAIEDKLQEEVAETITMLRKAGITTWMVTGDKKETAVNLGYASGK